MSSDIEPFPPVVELNVGGQAYTTALSTLTKDRDSLLAEIFTGRSESDLIHRDSRGRFFIDRDGQLFRYILDYLRTHKLLLPDNFTETSRLYEEARFYRLAGLMSMLGSSSQANATVNTALPTNGSSGKAAGFLTIGYRGTFAFGRDGLADVKFRKVSRILVSGKVSMAREVFRDTLNESRDPDRGQSSRYSARFYLKHIYLEQAFDMLTTAGFRFISCCASGTSSQVGPPETEESKWHHYNEFVFQRI